MRWLFSPRGSLRLKNKKRLAKSRRRRGREAARPLNVETLETRCLLSAHIVADLNTATGSSISLPEYTNVNGTAFFLADDGIHGRELWRSDGTAAGTHMVKDVNRGGGSAFNQFPASLVDVNGNLFFPANDGVHGYQLWKSDGTAAGTVMVTNINFGSGPTAGPSLLTNVDGTLFFSVRGGAPADVVGVWKSDGTPEGTMRLTNVPANNVGDMADVNGTLFFLGFDGVNQGLWKSNGTPNGTVFLKRVHEEEPTELVNINGTLFFNAADDDLLEKLWKSDGTPEGTVPVDEFNLLNSYPENQTNVNGTLFFQAGTDGFNNRQLWKSDGTDAGTQVVRAINPSGDAFGFQADRNSFANVNGTLYVTAFDGISQGIWKSDGTPNGTVLVKYVSASELTSANGSLFFDGSDVLQGTGLWTSDGTPDGTVLVKNLNAAGFIGLTNVNGRLFFRENDGIHGSEPWTSDGTAAGTMMVKDIFPGNQSANIQNPTELNGLVYFMNSAGDPGNAGLLATDGTAAGTVQVSSVLGTNLTKSGGLLYFNGPGARPTQRALWESDGTAAGTIRVANFGFGDSGPQNLTDVNGTLFFTETSSAGSPQLWVSDGTSGGTFQLTMGVSISGLTAVNSTLFFALDDGVHGSELWISDGTQGGTHLVKDINPGPIGSSPANLTNVNGTLYFTANDGMSGRELWESDGTPEGTFLAADINPGPDGSDPTNLTVSNGLLYFSAFTPATGRELWDYDPATGIASVFDIKPGSAGSNPSSLTDVGGQLFFAANDGTDGRELWVTDGTPGGTRLVADIRPGGAGSKPEYLFAMNGILYFTANDGAHGRELWQSDGTADGTSLVQDINPGRGSAFHSFYNPDFTAVNDQLFFVADDRVHGRELWVFTPDGAPGGASRHGINRAIAPAPVDLARALTALSDSSGLVERITTPNVAAPVAESSMESAATVSAARPERDWKADDLTGRPIFRKESEKVPSSKAVGTEIWLADEVFAILGDE